jgi:tetratricopeptide (TPR) repeat protein
MASLKRAAELRLGVRRTQAKLKELQQAGADQPADAELGGAYLELAEYLSQLERFPQALEAFTAAAEHLTTGGERRQATQVRVRLVGVLMVLGRREEALATVEAVIAAGESGRGTAESISMAYLWRVIALQELGRDREALSGARRLVKRYGPGTTEFQRQVVAKARLAESQLALRCGDPVASIRAANQLIRTYQDDPRPDTQALVADARAAVATATAAAAPTPPPA